MSWPTSELRVSLALWNRFKPYSKIFYWPFQGGTSFVDLLCLFLSTVCYAFVRVCLYVPFDHLLGKGWLLGSRLWCLTVSLSLSNWYPGSGVVLDCIDSWSLQPTSSTVNINLSDVTNIYTTLLNIEWVYEKNNRSLLFSGSRKIPTLGSTVQWETRQASFPTGTVNHRVGIGLNNIFSDKVHDIHRYNVKIVGSDSKPVAYLDHLLTML